jgi:hypothetical protein
MATAKQLNLPMGSVTALVDRPDTKGLVTLLREEDDRRVVTVQTGANMFESIGTIYRGFSTHHQRVVAAYPAAQQFLTVNHLTDLAQPFELQVIKRV